MSRPTTVATGREWASRGRALCEYTAAGARLLQATGTVDRNPSGVYRAAGVRGLCTAASADAPAEDVLLFGAGRWVCSWCRHCSTAAAHTSWSSTSSRIGCAGRATRRGGDGHGRPTRTPRWLSWLPMASNRSRCTGVLRDRGRVPLLRHAANISVWRSANNAKCGQPYDIFHNDWRIIGSFAACYTFLPSIAWLASGVINVTPLVSHRVGFDGFAEAFAQFAAARRSSACAAAA